MVLLEFFNWAMRTDLVVMPNICYVGVAILALAGVMSGMSYKKTHRALKEKQAAGEHFPWG